jgi:hypothetical protein
MFFKLWSPHEMAGRGGSDGAPLKRLAVKVQKDARNVFISIRR